MIVGEGGVGKTSLACQIARWGMGLDEDNTRKPKLLASHWMLPVLIEQDLEKTSPVLGSRFC